MVKKGNKVTNSSDSKVVNKRNGLLQFINKSRKRKIIAIIVFGAVLVSIIDVLIGHYHIFVIPKWNQKRPEFYFKHDGINYYLGDGAGTIMFYGFFPTTLKREIKSGRVKFDEITRKAIKTDPKCWCTREYYTTSFAKFIYCGITPDGEKVIVIPITSKFDGEYC